ncbi:MAG: hypothetical protein VXA66_05755 [Alphaproteobacteria bacterium]
MASATIPNSAGPGSSVQLDPKTIKVRDAVIGRCETQTLEQMNEFVKSLLAQEKDEMKRLGILAARVFILRQRIQNLGGDPVAVDAKKLIAGEDEQKPETKASTDEGETETGPDQGWTRLRIIKDCEVNGVRFFEGVIVDVMADDANRLIENGSAEQQTKSAPEAAEKSEASEAETKEASAETQIDAPAAKEQQSEDAEGSEAAAETGTDAEAEAEAQPETEVDTADASSEDAASAEPSTPVSDEDASDEALRAINEAADKAEAEAAAAAEAEAATEAETGDEAETGTAEAEAETKADAGETEAVATAETEGADENATEATAEQEAAPEEQDKSDK